MVIEDYFAGSHLLKLMTRYLHLGWDSPNTYIPKICTCVCCSVFCWYCIFLYCYVIMGAIVSQITSFTIVYSTVYWGADQRKHQSSTSLAFVRGIHRSPVNSQHKWPVTRQMFPIDEVMISSTHNIQDCFTCSKAIVWLPQIRWKWSIPGAPLY